MDRIPVPEPPNFAQCGLVYREAVIEGLERRKPTNLRQPDRNFKLMKDDLVAFLKNCFSAPDSLTLTPDIPGDVVSWGSNDRVRLGTLLLQAHLRILVDV